MNRIYPPSIICISNTPIVRLVLLLISAIIISCTPQAEWMKGNMHTHTFWSDGDTYRAGTERIWDIVLAHRMISGDGMLLYGIATDDAHNYHGGGAGPGKGWVMVRSSELTPEHILDAMHRGEFYASTGVLIDDLHCSRKSLSFKIIPAGGVHYLTEFIGTRKGFDMTSTPTVDSAGTEIPNTTRTYSDEIGTILATSTALDPVYHFSGDELYVRARITSGADQVDPLSGKVLGKQRAWLQPQIQRNR